jgi:competence protein ComEC
MNRPLVSVVVAYAAGLLLAPLWQPPLTALIGASSILLVLVLVLGQIRKILIWPLLALLGWTNFCARTAVTSPHDLRTVLGNETALVTVRGTLAETPRLKITVRDDDEIWRSVARVRVGEIRRDDTLLPVTGELLVTTPGIPGTDYFAGQNVEISGVISRPPTPLAEGLFDFQHYLETRGIYYQFKAGSTNDWKLLAPLLPGPPLTDRFLHWSQQTLALGLPEEDEPLRLLWAMTLGWRTAFTGEIGEPFLRAGTMHMFAIDGLRIALLSGIIVTLLRVLRLSRAWCGAIAVPIIWFYTAATGWEASAVRASVMMSVVLGGWALKRPTDLLNSLAAAALVILVWEPRQLFEASFQLSFFVVLVIALMLPRLNDWFDRVINHDPLLPTELLPRRKRLVLRFGRQFARYCGLSFAAWAGSIPLAAKYFHLFSPVSTLANVFAVPLGTFALMANLGALICGHWLPRLTELFNHAAWFFMVAMQWVSIESARLPGAYFYVPEPSWPTIFIYYVALIAAFSGWLKTARRIIFGAAAVVFIGAVYFWQWQSARDETSLTVLPLNGGHAIYVDADGRRNDWLINCGSENAVEFTLKNFLRAQGVNALPRLVLANADIKNCGGAVRLDELFNVGELWTSNAKFRSAAYRDAVMKFENASAGNSGRWGERHKILESGDAVGCWQIVSPASTANFSRADDAPIVLLGTFRETRILLLSDLSRSGQSELLSGTNSLRADIVVAGLPTEGEPLCGALIAAIQPKIIVIADSQMPATRRASRTLKERLEQEKVPAIYTRTTGAVKIVTDRHGWKLQTMDGQNISSHP